MTSSVPKAVVFDLGKVLLHFDYGVAISRLRAKCRFTELELQALINQSPLLYQFETNLLSTDEFFAEVKTLAGYEGDFEEFSTVFCDIFSPIDAMIEMQQTLRARGVPTYIFSNTNHLQIGYIRKTYPFLANFDGYVLSCDHGAMKPDHKIYEVVENLTGHRGGNLLYIDDRPENVEAGAARGWQAILHETPEKTISAVKKSGVLD